MTRIHHLERRLSNSHPDEWDRIWDNTEKRLDRKPLTRDELHHLAQEVTDDLAKLFRRDIPLWEVSVRPMRYNGGETYLEGKRIVLSTDLGIEAPRIIAHEIGHVMLMERGKMYRQTPAPDAKLLSEGWAQYVEWRYTQHRDERNNYATKYLQDFERSIEDDEGIHIIYRTATVMFQRLADIVSERTLMRDIFSLKNDEEFTAYLASRIIARRRSSARS